jgi:hypothetical protein
VLERTEDIKDFRRCTMSNLKQDASALAIKRKVVLKKWRELRGMLEPTIALHFTSENTWKNAHNIACNEGIHYALPGGGTNIIVPEGLVCLFEHLCPERVPKDREARVGRRRPLLTTEEASSLFREKAKKYE